MGLDKEYLGIYAEKDGVVKTPSGLMYKVLEQGNGTKPTPADTVEVHYEGKLVDDSVFDSSYKRGKTISFPLNAVIPGWTEGLLLMNTGSVYEFCIPSNLGYGPKGYPPVIPPGATLIFKVDLRGIE